MARLIFWSCLFMAMMTWPSSAQDVTDSPLPVEKSSFLKDRLEVGGWFDILLLDQGRDAVDDYFNLYHFYTTFNLKLTDSMNVFTEVEYANIPELNSSDTEVEFEIDRAYLEYRSDQRFRLRLGKFNTPAGIWKPIHWSVLVDTIALPIMEQNDYIPTSSVGVELFGRKYFGESELNYDFLFSIGSGDDLGDNSDSEAVGGDFRYIFRERYTLGISYYNYKDVEGENGSVNGILSYADIHLLANRLLWRTEFLTLTRSDTSDIKAFYSKLKYQINRQLYLNYRFDRADDENIEPKGDEHIMRVATLGYWPKTFLRFKLEYADHKFENDSNSFVQYAAWMGFIF